MRKSYRKSRRCKHCGVEIYEGHSCNKKSDIARDRAMKVERETLDRCQTEGDRISDGFEMLSQGDDSYNR